MRYVWLVAFFALGCGPKVSPDPNPFDEDLTPLSGQASGAASTEGTRAPATKLREGEIPRVKLLPVLDAGPPNFLKDLDLQAVTDGNTFVGWRIAQIVSPTSPAALADLRPGDVVHSANGNPLDRPDKLMATWDSLRTAATLEVIMTRDDKPYSLLFTITDEK